MVFLNESLQLQICYTDDEGDTIYITNDGELEEAIRFAHRQGKVFRFFVPKEVVMPRTPIGADISEGAPAEGNSLEQIWNFSSHDFQDMLAARVKAMAVARKQKCRQQKKKTEKFSLFMQELKSKLDHVQRVLCEDDDDDDDVYQCDADYGVTCDGGEADALCSFTPPFVTSSTESHADSKKRLDTLAARYGESVRQFDPRVQAHLADCLMSGTVPNVVPPPPPLPVFKCQVPPAPPAATERKQREGRRKKLLRHVIKAAMAFRRKCMKARRNFGKAVKDEKKVKKSKAVKKTKMKKAKKALGKALQKAKKKVKKFSKKRKEKGDKLQKKLLKDYVNKKEKTKPAKQNKTTEVQSPVASPPRNRKSLFFSDSDDDLFLSDTDHMEECFQTEQMKSPTTRTTATCAKLLDSETQKSNGSNNLFDQSDLDEDDQSIHYSMDWSESDDDDLF